MRPLLITALCLLALSTTIQAEIFKTVDKYGNVTYTDNPRDKTAEPIKLPPVNVQPAEKIKSRPTKKEEDKNAAYQLSITSPAHDSTVPTGQTTVSVAISLEPSLNKDHKLLLLLDGKPYGKPGSSTLHVIAEISRGSHSLQARVLDASGKSMIQSDTVTIHVKRHSILNKSGS